MVFALTGRPFAVTQTTSFAIFVTCSSFPARTRSMRYRTFWSSISSPFAASESSASIALAPASTASSSSAVTFSSVLRFVMCTPNACSIFLTFSSKEPKTSISCSTRSALMVRSVMVSSLPLRCLRVPAGQSFPRTGRTRSVHRCRPAG